MTGVLVERENLETDTLHGMEVEGRDWGDAFQAKKCQSLPDTSSSYVRGREQTLPHNPPKKATLLTP